MAQVASETIDYDEVDLAERANIPVAEATLITAWLKPNPVLSVGSVSPLELVRSRVAMLQFKNQVPLKSRWAARKPPKSGRGRRSSEPWSA